MDVWFFGLLHGVGLSINHIYNKFFGLRLHKTIGWFLTFNFVNLSFIFFRSQDFNEGLIIIYKMFNFNNFFIDASSIIPLGKSISLILISLILSLFFKNSYEMFYKYLENKRK